MPPRVDPVAVCFCRRRGVDEVPRVREVVHRLVESLGVGDHRPSVCEHQVCVSYHQNFQRLKVAEAPNGLLVAHARIQNQGLEGVFGMGSESSLDPGYAIIALTFIDECLQSFEAFDKLKKSLVSWSVGSFPA